MFLIPRRGETLHRRDKKKHPEAKVREWKNKLHLVVVRDEALDEEEEILCTKLLEFVGNVSEKLWRLKEEVQKLKKSYEEQLKVSEIQKEHIKKMRIIYHVSQAMRSVYDPNNLYRVILLSLVSERGFSFDRAVLLKKDENTNSLVVVSAMGGDTPQEHEELKRYLRKEP